MEPHEIVTLIYSGAMCLIGLLSFVLGRRDRSNDEKKDDCEDSKEAGKQDGLVMNKLGVIEHGIDSIERRLDKQDDRYLNLVPRLVSLNAMSAIYFPDTLPTKKDDYHYRLSDEHCKFRVYLLKDLS